MGLKSIVLKTIAIPEKIHNFIVLRRRKVECCGKVNIRGRIKIFGRGKIFFGKGVKINSKLAANPIGGDTQTVLFCDKGAELVVGNNTGMSNCAIVAKQSVTIGNNVKIGGSVKIYDNDFHALDATERNFGSDKPKCAPVVIKDGAFIGAFSIILKGVTIGENSIVGAGSVVTKNIPDNEIWAGNPAKFIKKI